MIQLSPNTQLYHSNVKIVQLLDQKKATLDREEKFLKKLGYEKFLKIRYTRRRDQFAKKLNKMIRLKNFEPDYFVSTWISDLLYGIKNVVYSGKSFKVIKKRNISQAIRKDEINSTKMSNREHNQDDKIFQAKKFPLPKTLNLDQNSLL